LTEQHKDVEHAYLERQQAIKDQREAALELLDAQSETLREERDDQKARQDAALAALDKAHNEHRLQGQDSFREREYQLKLEQNRRQQQVESVGYTEQENLALAILDRRQEELDEKLDAAESKV